jgi:hypothetical protein
MEKEKNFQEDLINQENINYFNLSSLFYYFTCTKSDNFEKENEIGKEKKYQKYQKYHTQMPLNKKIKRLTPIEEKSFNFSISAIENEDFVLIDKKIKNNDINLNDQLLIKKDEVKDTYLERDILIEEKHYNLIEEKQFQKKTLVLDLDETLIHSTFESKIYLLLKKLIILILF